MGCCEGDTDGFTWGGVKGKGKVRGERERERGKRGGRWRVRIGVAKKKGEREGVATWISKGTLMLFQILLERDAGELSINNSHINKLFSSNRYFTHGRLMYSFLGFSFEFIYIPKPVFHLPRLTCI